MPSEPPAPPPRRQASAERAADTLVGQVKGEAKRGKQDVGKGVTAKFAVIPQRLEEAREQREAEFESVRWSSRQGRTI